MTFQIAIIFATRSVDLIPDSSTEVIEFDMDNNSPSKERSLQTPRGGF